MIMPMLSTRDLKASLDFYERGLGFTTATLMKDGEGNDNFAIVTLSQAAMIGIGLHEAPQPVGSGVELMVYVPDEVDIDQHYAMAVANGISVPNGIKTEYWGDRLYTVTDPDGYRISICKTVQQLTNEEIAPVHAERASAS